MSRIRDGAPVPRIVKISVVAADCLAKRDLWHLPDPFAVVTVNGDKQGETLANRRTLNPYWNEKFDLMVTESSIITVQIFDARNFNKQDQGFLGAVHIRVGGVLDLQLGGHERLHMDLEGNDDNPQVCGRLVLDLSTAGEAMIADQQGPLRGLEGFSVSHSGLLTSLKPDLNSGKGTREASTVSDNARLDAAEAAAGAIVGGAAFTGSGPGRTPRTLVAGKRTQATNTPLAPGITTARAITGRTFDGEPFQISISAHAFDRGASAGIYKGEILGGEPQLVAVKVAGMLGPFQKELLARELRTAQQVSRRHPSILPYVGTVDVGEERAIVSLYMRNGNLMEYLQSRKDCDKKRLVVQVAEAVNYLHTVEGLVHGDLKCANILISDSENAMLADFGLSTFVEKSRSTLTTATSIRNMSTIRFAAPEILLGQVTSDMSPRSKTRASDVYAFGMLVLEAVTEQPPWANSATNDLAVMLQVCAGKHPPQPQSNGVLVAISHSWWELCRRCWAFDPNQRPAMDVVRDGLIKTAILPRRELHGHTSKVESLAYFPIGNKVVSGSTDMSVRVWDAATGHVVLDPLFGHRASVMCVSVLHDGRQIVSVGDDGTIHCWDAVSGASVGTPVTVRGVDYPAFSADSRLLVSCDEEYNAHLWDIEARQPLAGPMEGHRSAICAAAFSPDATRIATAATDRTIRLWDNRTGAHQTMISVDIDVCSLCFLHEGKLVSGHISGTVQIWDVTTSQHQCTLRGHSQKVGVVVPSPSGGYLASGSDDTTICIWNTVSWELAGKLTGHSFRITSLAFHPQGKSVASGSEDGALRVWDLFG